MAQRVKPVGLQDVSSSLSPARYVFHSLVYAAGGNVHWGRGGGGGEEEGGRGMLPLGNRKLFQGAHAHYKLTFHDEFCLRFGVSMQCSSSD